MFTIINHQSPQNILTPLLQGCVKNGESILYLRGNPSQYILTSVCVNQETKYITIRQCSINSKVQISIKLEQQQIATSEIDFAFVQNGDGFIIYHSPFSIYFISGFGQQMIKLNLDKQINFDSCAMDLTYPSLLIYGKQKGQTKSQVIQLNLETLCFKTINDGKGYSPGPRRQQLSVFADNRIYVFGGYSKQSVKCPQLLYTFDIEKGYWFALEMKYPQDENFRQCKTVPISKSKILIVQPQQPNKCWVLQIHQSKLTQVTNSQNTFFSDKIVSVNENFVWYSRQKCGICNKKVKYEKK